MIIFVNVKNIRENPHCEWWNSLLDPYEISWIQCIAKSYAILIMIPSAADSLGALSESCMLPDHCCAHHPKWSFHVQCIESTFQYHAHSSQFVGHHVQRVIIKLD